MTQLTPISGFTNTPITKFLCITTTAGALALSIFGLKHYVRFELDPFIIEYGQYWRVLLHQMAVVNESDYMLAVVLLFHYKTLERFYGSNKYLSLITFFAFYNGLVTLLVMALGNIVVAGLHWALRGRGLLDFSTSIFNEVAPGPLGIISSLYMCYAANIPVSYHFKIMLRPPTSSSSTHISLTNHFQVQILYTLLLLNNGIQSIIPCLVGLFIGKLYTNNLLVTYLLPSGLIHFLIHPTKFLRRSAERFQSRVLGYQAVPEEEEPDDEPDENVDTIRAETPVRPLGRQFLDTFRQA